MNCDTIDSYFYSLARVVDAIYQEESLEDTLQFICSLSTELTGGIGSTIRALEHGTFKLKVLASYGLSDTYLNSRVIDYAKSVTEIERGEVVIINDVRKDPRIHDVKAAQKEGIHAVIGLPFTVNDTTYCILRIYFKAKKKPSQDEMEMLNSLGQLGCLAIEHAVIGFSKNNRK